LLLKNYTLISLFKFTRRTINQNNLFDRSVTISTYGKIHGK